MLFESLFFFLNNISNIEMEFRHFGIWHFISYTIIKQVNMLLLPGLFYPIQRCLICTNFFHKVHNCREISCILDI